MSETPLYEQIYQHIVHEIESGRLKPHERVPSEKELAEQFNVSRITSKSALEKLSQAGYIERMRGRGSFVAESQPGREPQPLKIELPAETGGDRSLIGLVTPDISDSFGVHILRKVEKELSRLNYDLLLKFTYNNQQLEEQAVRSLIEAGVKGMIVFPVNGELYNSDLLRLVYSRFPLVLVDKYLKGIPASAVYTDNRKASEELTEYLLQKGHTRIAFVSSSVENTSSIEERLQGFISAHMKRGIGVNQQTCFTSLSHFSTENGFEAEKKKLGGFLDAHREVTAFFAAEYHNAVFIRDMLREMGQGDREIVCFDAQNAYSVPDFVHILQDEEAIGARAVDLLLAQIGGEGTPLHNVIDYKLIMEKKEELKKG